MKRFSMGAAIGEAFGLMRRRPLAVFVWGLLVLGPVLVGLTMILPAMGAMVADMPDDPTAAESEFTARMMAGMLHFQLASMLMNLGQLLGMVVAYTAIMRAVLRPAERSVFSLRLGMDELRVAVVGLAIGIGAYAAVLAVFLVGAGLVAALWSVGEGVAMGAAAVLGVAALVGLFWGMARVSLMAPASVLYRDFAFSQGWSLAAGKAWSLFGMMLVILLIVLAVEAVLVLIGVFAAGAVFASWPGEWSAAADPFTLMQGWMAANWPWLAVAAVLAVGFYGFLMTLTIAPFASACRQLADSAPDAAAGTTSPSAPTESVSPA